MAKKKLKTKENYFAMLDAHLTPDEKKEMTKHSSFDYHFTLGMWIRNNWIHTAKTDELDNLIQAFDETYDTTPIFGNIRMSYYFDPDSFSNEIISQYIDYLKTKKL